MKVFQDLEFRSAEQRRKDGLVALGETIRTAREEVAFWASRLPDPGLGPLKPEALVSMPILRKAELPALQAANPPFGGLAAGEAGAFPRLFLSPGPIYEPGGMGESGAQRALRAAGVKEGDVVLNTFGYHLTPAGLMFDDAARALGTAVIPAGGGNTAQIVQAMGAYRATVYIGTPDYLNILLQAATAAGVSSALRVALVSGAALPASLRALFAEQGIEVFEQFGTAELGIIAYETASHDGLVLNESLWAEIVAPDTGEPMSDGDVGELVVTLFRKSYPLIRFGTGDLSAFVPGMAASGHTNRRLRGWLGRSDDAVKVKGMFLRPSMLAEVLGALPAPAPRARFVVERVDERDQLLLELEGEASDQLAKALQQKVREVTRLGSKICWAAPDELVDTPPITDRRMTNDE